MDLSSTYDRYFFFFFLFHRSFQVEYRAIQSIGRSDSSFISYGRHGVSWTIGWLVLLQQEFWRSANYCYFKTGMVANMSTIRPLGSDPFGSKSPSSDWGAFFDPIRFFIKCDSNCCFIISEIWGGIRYNPIFWFYVRTVTTFTLRSARDFISGHSNLIIFCSSKS